MFIAMWTLGPETYGGGGGGGGEPCVARGMHYNYTVHLELIFIPSKFMAS